MHDSSRTSRQKGLCPPAAVADRKAPEQWAPEDVNASSVHRGGFVAYPDRTAFFWDYFRIGADTPIITRSTSEARIFPCWISNQSGSNLPLGFPAPDGEAADGRHASDHARSPIYRAAAPRCLSNEALISPKAALPMCVVLPGGLLLLCQAQDSGQHTWFHGNRTDAGVALLCKNAQNTSRGHHEKEIATQFLEYSRRIVPADALRNVICQITRHQFLRAHR